MKNYVVALLLAGIFVTGCSKEETKEQTQQQPVVEQQAPEEMAPQPPAYIPQYDKSVVEALPVTSVSGTVVDFTKALAGQPATLTPEDVKTLAQNKMPFGFITKAGSKESLHLLYNADGTYPGESMAALTTMSTSLKGRVLAQNGVSLVFVDSFGAPVQ